MPYGPGDSEVHGPEGALHVHTSYKASKARHVVENVLRHRVAKMPPPNSSFYWSDEQRAMYEVLRQSPGACWWLAPDYYDEVVPPALFVVLEAGKG